jgi:hypothetical protein
VLVDVAVTHGVPGWAAGVPVAAVVYAAAFLQDSLAVLPPWNWWSAAPVAVGFGLLWAGVDRLAAAGWTARWREPVEPGRTCDPAAPDGRVPALHGAARGAARDTADDAAHDTAHDLPDAPGASPRWARSRP